MWELEITPNCSGCFPGGSLTVGEGVTRYAACQKVPFAVFFFSVGLRSGLALAYSSAGLPPPPCPSYPGGVWGVPWRFSVPPFLSMHRRSVRLCCPDGALLFGGCDCADLGKSDAWPLSPFPAIPHPIGCCSSTCGDLCLLSPGFLFCSSKISAARSGCCGGFSAGS